MSSNEKKLSIKDRAKMYEQPHDFVSKKEGKEVKKLDMGRFIKFQPGQESILSANDKKRIENLKTKLEKVRNIENAGFSISVMIDTSVAEISRVKEAPRIEVVKEVIILNKVNETKTVLSEATISQVFVHPSERKIVINEEAEKKLDFIENVDTREKLQKLNEELIELAKTSNAIKENSPVEAPPTFAKLGRRRKNNSALSTVNK